MTTPPTSDVTHAEPFRMPRERKCPFNPPSELEELRESQPISRFVFPGGRVGWIVSNHELARAVMGDQRFSRGASGSPLSAPENQAVMILDAIKHTESFPDVARETVERYNSDGRLADALWDPELIRALHDDPLAIMPYSNMDPPKHTRIRQVLNPYFSVRAVNKHRARIERIIEDCLDDMEKAGSPVDFVKAFAVAMPSRMISEILGVPESDREVLERLGAVRNKPGVTGEEILDVNEKIRGFIRDLVQSKREQPADDLISELIKDGELNQEELISAVILLDLAAVLTTSMTLTSGIAVLLRDRDQWDKLREGSADLDRVVEELLRFTSPVQGAEIRTALEDVEVGGVVIKAYERVAVSLAAANRDPSVFSEPNHFDSTRQATKQMTFGFGVHHCLGQHLVRLELQIALTALVRRFPSLDLAIPVDDIAWPVDDVEIWGPQELPVLW